MSGQNLVLELKEKQKLLDDALNSMKYRGIEYAKAERESRKAITQFYLVELNKGIDVQPRCHGK